MKVGELIEKLKAFDPDMEVRFEDFEYDESNSIDDVYLKTSRNSLEPEEFILLT